MDPHKQTEGKAAGVRQPDVYDVLAWFEVNKGRIALIAVLLVVVGFSIVTARYLRQQKEVKASTALLELKPALVPGTNTPPAPASAFLKVAQEHSGTSAAERAGFYAATTLFTENKYAEAEAQFSQFLRDHRGSPWAASAAYGLAAAQEAQNKTEAQASYQMVISSWPNSAVAEMAKLDLARIYESKNQPEQALRIYNELLAALPQGGGDPLTADVGRLKEALLRHHPALNTNRPAPAPVAPTLSAAPNGNTAAPTTSAPAAATAPQDAPSAGEPVKTNP